MSTLNDSHLRLVFATNNIHKIEEVKHILGAGWEVLSLAESEIVSDLPENGDTLHANAEEKANAIHDQIALPCFAEDSGLEVDALEGAPGVHTARYAGEGASAQQNNQKLLEALSDITDRSARFRAVIALWWRDELVFFEGVINGRIATKLDGLTGFGYDPLFIPEGYDKPFAALPTSIKSQISHRARAVAKMVDFLKQQSNPQ